MKKQKCKNCDKEMLLTEIHTDTGYVVWAYMCDCDDMIRDAKALKERISSPDALNFSKE